ncbi:hypothetical protein B0G83_103226 [Paraburkholderia sp. BL21I4N1]|nr:hypothetical protein B0G83_103226 [Paraburkholderia sp. BL21I4N1]
MLQRVASGRGVATLPRWLVEAYAGSMNLVPVRLARLARLGRKGIARQIFLGARETDIEVDYLKAFVDLARKPETALNDQEEIP